MKILYHPDREALELSSVLYALSDPNRLLLVSELARCGEMTCNALPVPVAKSTLSHHVRTLREAGVVHVRIHGTQRLITLRMEDLEQRFPGLMTAVLQSSPMQEKASEA